MKNFIQRNGATFAASVVAIAVLASLAALLQRERETSDSTEQRPAAPERVAGLREAIDDSYRATLDAFATDGDDTEFERRDERSKLAAQRLQDAVEAARAKLGPEVAGACETLVSHISAAQVQLMAFAINRKNRGLPDAAEIEMETADRRAWTADIAPVYERLMTVLPA
ncbi:MAG: hypothetical protein NVS1B2_19430 [Vulcanimicrobiaceae bacterium]